MVIRNLHSGRLIRLNFVPARYARVQAGRGAHVRLGEIGCVEEQGSSICQRQRVESVPILENLYFTSDYSVVRIRISEEFTFANSVLFSSVAISFST